jgi:hypothetical protein
MTHQMPMKHNDLQGGVDDIEFDLNVLSNRELEEKIKKMKEKIRKVQEFEDQNDDDRSSSDGNDEDDDGANDPTSYY